jgi:hypothetical protein
MSQSRYEYLISKYVETNLISNEHLINIIAADPTSFIEGEKGIKVGKYSQWILKLYERLYEVRTDGTLLFNDDPSVFFEDLYKLLDDLQVYDRIKVKKDLIPQDKKDINNIKDAWELYQLVNAHRTVDIVLTKAEVKQKVIAQDVELMLDGDRWDIISPKTSLAATTVSGPPLTRWCTAADGRNQFEGYAKQGSLYIVRDKSDIIHSGRGAGQPRPIWQFHFESNSFMDVDDRRVDILQILRDEPELKKMFKPLMVKHFLKSKMVAIKYPNDNVSKFIVLYGFEDFLDSLPIDITDLDIDCQSASPAVKFSLPKSIKRFKKLEKIYFQACIDSIPDEICELTELQNLSLPNNTALKTLPKSIAKLPKLITINLRGSVNVQIPTEIKQLDDADKIYIIHSI